MSTPYVAPQPKPIFQLKPLLPSNQTPILVPFPKVAPTGPLPNIVESEESDADDIYN